MAGTARLSGRRFAKPPTTSSRSSAAAAAGSAAPAIEREAATSTDAGWAENAGPSSAALPPWAPTPGTRKIESGISSRSRPRWRGSVAPTTAPIALSPDSPASRGARSATIRARRSCRGASPAGSVEHVRGARVGGAHEGEDAGPAVRGGRDQGLERIAAEQRVDGRRVGGQSSDLSPRGLDRAEQRLPVCLRAHRHVTALAVGDHQQPGVSGRGADLLERAPSRASRGARSRRAAASPRRMKRRSRRSACRNPRQPPRPRPRRASRPAEAAARARRGPGRGRGRPGCGARRRAPRAGRRRVRPGR